MGLRTVSLDLGLDFWRLRFWSYPSELGSR